MKYTEKIGKNGYITIEDKDIPSSSVSSFGDFIMSWVVMMLGVFIGLGIIFGISKLLEFIFG